MLPNYKKAMATFKEQKEEVMKPTRSYSHVPPKNQRGADKTVYTTFLAKLEDLEKYIDSFSSVELVFYFREIAQRNGYRYVISSLEKEARIMKLVKKDFSNREICGLIEFLYESEQDYLDKNRLSVNILKSAWINTLFADMQDWVEDNYTPKSQASNVKQKQVRSHGEFNSNMNDYNTQIGIKL